MYKRSELSVDTFENIVSRRSVRGFITDKEIPEEMIEKITEILSQE